jgi:NhaA family Na+:H+ antiporter
MKAHTAGQVKAAKSSDAFGGILLFIAAALSLFGANSPWSENYFALMGSEWAKHFIHAVNDGLMVIFFLLVGLEIKREFLGGELVTKAQRILPISAAAGGMVVPALLFWAVVGESSFAHGWAIPCATDIAFSLGVLALVGKHVPTTLKIFLTALAIVDDLGAILIIAFFYSHELALIPFFIAKLILAILVLLNLKGVRSLPLYLFLGLCMWACVFNSGVHATIAGVLLALTIPFRPKGGGPVDENEAPLLRLEHALKPWVTFLILPIFAFVNSGVNLQGVTAATFMEPLTLAIIVGLFVGKQVGVFSFAALAIELGYAKIPNGSSWAQLYGVALLCGIGFTMSLFIGDLAFPAGDVTPQVRLGVISGSLLSMVFGALVLKFACARAQRATALANRGADGNSPGMVREG